ncbi:hypothetical protein ACHAQJ_010641 [Trichoderma viride]
MSATAALFFYDASPVTVDEARDLEEDFVKLWLHDRAMEKFYRRLSRHQNHIKALTRHHLQLRKEEITIAPLKDWIHGTFNLCIPIQVKYSHACRKFMFRCPMPHKLAEAQYAGTVNEKMGCEVGAYVWMQEKCPNIRIPYLYGFGFTDGRYACIGSFQFVESGVITLTNRPLTSSIVTLENEGAQRTIQSNQVYHSTEDFVVDTLKLHDNAFISNPNAACDDEECYSHMAARASLRAVSHHYIRREQRNGPYFLQFTDLTRSNIFVDDDWNITCLLDLEWISALPVEMISVPYWLSGCDKIDGLTGEDLTKFMAVRREFMHQFKQEEDEMKMEHDTSLTAAINHGWTSRSLWFWYTMNTGSTTLYPIVKRYIYGSFSVGENDADKTAGVLSALWRHDSAIIARKKRDDYSGYIHELEQLVKEHGKPVAKGP